MRRTKEGGSVITFVVIAVVLVGLLVGGAYAVRRMTTQPQQQTPAAPQSSPSDGSQNQPAAPAPSQPQVTTPPPQQSSPQASVPASQLPHTGPEELFGTIVALGALSMASVAYVRSRRPELQF